MLPSFSIFCSSSPYQSCVSFQFVAPLHLRSSSRSLSFLWAPIYYLILALVFLSAIVTDPFSFQYCCAFHCIICLCSASNPFIPFVIFTRSFFLILYRFALINLFACAPYLMNGITHELKTSVLRFNRIIWFFRTNASLPNTAHSIRDNLDLYVYALDCQRLLNVCVVHYF